MEKLIRDGCVAVLVSHGYGSGWYSWNGEQAMLFDPVLAEMLSGGASDDSIQNAANQRYPNIYLGGLEGLTLHWVPEGERFRIEEYDGAETLCLESDYTWVTA